MPNISFSPTQILYEDSNLIVVNKAHGQVVQSDKEGNTSLLDELKTSRKIKFCEIVNRLDRPVSGIVVYAKNKEALANLNHQFHEHSVGKIYWAIVEKKEIERKATLINFIKKNEKINKSFIVTPDTKYAQKAELDYEIIAESDNYNLLEVILKTGRHHQIRVQLANIGCPVKGDVKYGSRRSNKDSSISLHARKITFLHPVKKEPISITASMPNDSLWNYFAEVVK